MQMAVKIISSPRSKIAQKSGFVRKLNSAGLGCAFRQVNFSLRSCRSDHLFQTVAMIFHLNLVAQKTGHFDTP
jgi:hypothetical protein